MAPQDSTSAAEAEKKEAVTDQSRCVSCGWKVKTLFVQYSRGNIRLMKCDNCKAVADPYIECEFMIILIDLILHKTRAYRHLLFNMLNIGARDSKGLLWKSWLLYLLLDAYRIFLVSKPGLDSAISLPMSIWIIGKVLVNVVLPTLIFMLIILLGIRLLLDSANSLDMARYKGIMLAILVSSYFKLFQVAMMVWDFPPSVLLIVDIFVLTSNTVSLEVITDLQRTRCLAVCICAHAFKKIQHLQPFSLRKGWGSWIGISILEENILRVRLGGPAQETVNAQECPIISVINAILRASTCFRGFRRIIFSNNHCYYYSNDSVKVYIKIYTRERKE